MGTPYDAMPSDQAQPTCRMSVLNRPAPRTRPALTAWLPAVLVGLICAPVSADPGTPPGPPWLPELGEAFTLYYAGEDQQVMQRCREILQRGPGTELRRQALLLDAFVRLRGSERAERATARLSLGELAADNPAWLDRPETQLAVGRGLLELAETSAALDQLARAIEGFARQQRTARLLVALATDAEAWSRHTEWERPPLGRNMPAIADVQRREQVRDQQLDAIRTRAAELPGSDACLQAIDLAWARVRLRRGETADALRQLRDIVARPPYEAAWAAAALELADLDPASAADLLERVVDAGVGETAQTAADRLRDLRTPRLDLGLPRTVAPETPVPLKITARRLADLQLEVRRLDLPAWLASQQGRLLPARLPIAGPLVQQQGPLDPAGAPPELRLPSGQYVVVVRGRAADGTERERRELLVVSSLSATLLTGPGEAVLWTSTPTATASFWLHGSFVGREIAVRDGVARFKLPAERAMLSDDRWVCLVRSGDELTCCTGRAARPSRDGRPAASVALSLAPVEPRVGQTLTVYGLLVRPGEVPAGETVTLDLVDVDGQVRGARQVTARADGSLLTRIQIDPELAGASLTIQARIGEARIETLYRRARFNVPADDAADVRIALEVPARLPLDARMLEGTARMWSPTGIPVGGVAATVSARAVRLPDAEIEQPMPGQRIQERLDMVNADGTFDFAWGLQSYELPDGPLALGLRAEVSGWDFRSVGISRTVLRSDEPVHMWLHLPGRVQAGRPVPLRIGWADPEGLAATARPTLTITGPDGISSPSLIPAPGGLFSDAWSPQAVGRHVVRAELPLVAGSPAVAEQVVEVASLPEHADVVSRRYVATWDAATDSPRVRVRVTPPNRTSTLLILDDGDPVAAAELPPGVDEVSLPAPDTLSATARLHVVGRTDAAVAWLASESVGRPEDGLTLTAVVDRPPDGPGRSAAVTATCAGLSEGESALVTARLVSTSGVGSVPWIPAPVSALDGPQLGRLRVSTTLPGGVAAIAPPRPPLHPETLAALHEGTAHWLDSRAAADGRARLRVPLPPEPGRFLLLLTARTADGKRAAATIAFDTTADVSLETELPEAWLVGDRLVSRVTIRNPGEAAWEGHLQVDAGRGLELLTARGMDGAEVSVARTGGGAARIALHLSAGQSRSLRLGWEATRPGRGLAKFVLLSGDRRQQVRTRSYGVAADVAGGAGRQGVALSRSLFRLQPATGPEAVTSSAGSEWVPGQENLREYERVAVAPDEAVRPGTVLLVQEEWDSTAALNAVRWRQSVPANCVTANAGDAGGPTIGYRTRLVPGQVQFEVEQAGPGRLVHEWVLVAARAGACQVPLPEASTEVGPINWQAGPLRVVVRDLTR